MKDKILTIAEKLIRIDIKLLYKSIRRYKKNSEDFMMKEICKTVSNEKYDITFHLEPKIGTAIPIKPSETKVKENFAIVMQGPLRKEENFTLNTVNFYKKLYPEAYIIVSTWNDEDKYELEKLEKAGAIIVLNEKPQYSGQLNVNFQLVSTQGGIKKAKDLGVEYVAKTRTDQRINRRDIFNYLINMLMLFSIDETSNQKKRVVTLSMTYGNMFYPYFMSDFFYFGTTEDMMAVFNMGLDTREKFIMPPNSTRREYAEKLYAPEAFILKHYLVKMGCSGDGTIKDYWDGVRKFLICVDMKTLDIKWPKYDGKYRLHIYYGDYFYDDNDEKLKTENFDFVNWFNLYMGTLKYNTELEKYADVIFK